MCGEFEAMVIMTNLDTGESESPCGNCFPEFILNIAQGITGVAFDGATEPSDSPLRVVADEGDGSTPDEVSEPPGATEPDPKPSGRSRRVESVPSTDDDPVDEAINDHPSNVAATTD